MAENNWLLNDSAPAPLGQEFSAAAPAKAWGWFGLPAGEGSEFETAALPSTETPWTPAELAFNGAQGGGAVTYTYVGTGGILAAGAAPAAKGKTFAASGGVQSGGTAPISKGKVFAPAGGIQTSGTAPALKGKTFTATGGVQTGGNAALAKSKSYPASGGAQLAGTAPALKGKTFASSGGVEMAGESPVSKLKVYVTLGGFSLSGASSVSSTKSASVSGGVISGGVASTSFLDASVTTWSYTGSGGFSLAGGFMTAFHPAEPVIVPPVRGGGGGISRRRWPRRLPPLLPQAPSHTYIGSGGLRLQGAAVIALTFTYTYTSLGGLGAIRGDSSVITYLAPGAPVSQRSKSGDREITRNRRPETGNRQDKQRDIAVWSSQIVTEPLPAHPLARSPDELELLLVLSEL